MQKQFQREARWALWLTFIYMAFWVGLAYFLPTSLGLLGFPWWFEFACIYLPSGFVVLVYWVVKQIYQPVDLDGQSDEK